MKDIDPISAVFIGMLMIFYLANGMFYVMLALGFF